MRVLCGSGFLLFEKWVCIEWEWTCAVLLGICYVNVYYTRRGTAIYLGELFQYVSSSIFVNGVCPSVVRSVSVQYMPQCT